MITDGDDRMRFLAFGWDASCDENVISSRVTIRIGGEKASLLLLLAYFRRSKNRPTIRPSDGFGNLCSTRQTTQTYMCDGHNIEREENPSTNENFRCHLVITE